MIPTRELVFVCVYVGSFIVIRAEGSDGDQCVAFVSFPVIRADREDPSYPVVPYHRHDPFHPALRAVQLDLLVLLFREDHHHPAVKRKNGKNGTHVVRIWKEMGTRDLQSLPRDMRTIPLGVFSSLVRFILCDTQGQERLFACHTCLPGSPMSPLLPGSPLTPAGPNGPAGPCCHHGFFIC